MESEERVCQCHCIPKISLGILHTKPNTYKSWLKLTIKRYLKPQTKRKLKSQLSTLLQNLPIRDKNLKSSTTLTGENAEPLKAGDLVRVLSEKEILSTLNNWHELKGCMFMDAQGNYCDTVQRVLKPVQRFVDERDYQVKRAKGLVLLEGLVCEGTPDYGRCDRACFYFWREEWLEKINEQEVGRIPG